DLLTVDDPRVAVAHRAGSQTSEIGPRARLAEQLAPHLVTTEQCGDVAGLLLVGAVRQQGRDDHSHPHREDARVDVEARLLLREDPALLRGAAPTAVLTRYVDPGPAAAEQRALPFLAPAHVRGVGLGRVVGRRIPAVELVVAGAGLCVRLQPGARLGA